MNIDQLNLDFRSRQDFDGFWSYISTKVEALTNGKPLNEWIESIGNRLYVLSNSKTKHIDLGKYFELTNIKACSYRKELSVHARLISHDSHFIIELKDYGSRNDTRLHRFFVAHELAHTFFYNTKRVPFSDYRFFPEGSKEIEFLCNRISRSILMPTFVLHDKLRKLPIPNQDGFSLHAVNKLCNTFKVPHSVLLNRIIFDTGLWNCLFLRFRNYELEENNWKLRERYLPALYWNNVKAFIPIEDRKKSKDNPNRYPSAKGKLKEAFNHVYAELKTEKRITKKYSFRDIDDSPLKGFFKYYFDQSTEIKIHFSLGKDKYSRSDYLNVCIPFARTFT